LSEVEAELRAEPIVLPPLPLAPPVETDEVEEILVGGAASLMLLFGFAPLISLDIVTPLDVTDSSRLP
jgi:hypothetical protein